MTATTAGGGDWLDLPTAPVQHRGARKPAGLPWAQITEAYVARGGQVDAGVWHQGRVQIVEGGGRGKDRVHTYAERDGYKEPTAPANRPKVASTATGRRLTDAQRSDLCHRYRAGESIPNLAKAYGLSTSAVRNTLKCRDEPIRSLSDARKLDWENRR